MSAPAIPPQILEILVSRICHDLISPVGAINNGLELIEDMGFEDGAEALELVQSSATTAGARLSLFRMAYGAAGADTNLKAVDFAKSFQDWLQGTRVTMTWDDITDVNMVMPIRGYFKTMLNIMILAAECLGAGGTVQLEMSKQDPLTMVITATGEKVHFHDGCEDALAHKIDIEKCEPRHVHAYLTRLFAQHYGFTLNYQTNAAGHLIFTLAA